MPDDEILKGCIKLCAGQNCCGVQQKLRKRANRPQIDPGFLPNLPADLEGYVIDRTSGEAPAAGMRWVLHTSDDNLNPPGSDIRVQLITGPPAEIDIMMPTSIFDVPGTVPFGQAMTSLFGCTLVVIVKDFDANRPNDPMGVYMAHLWE